MLHQAKRQMPGGQKTPMIFYGNHRDKKDHCPYARPRKNYKRTHPYPTTTYHFKPLPREKTVVMMLTKKGYSINQLAKGLGRSTSYIHRIVRTAITRGITHFLDKRKLPSQIRSATSINRMKRLQKWLTLWEPFLLGEVDKPP